MTTVRDAEFVYPGHPVHLALQIMDNYPSLADAAMLGHSYPAALEDSRINGAGGAVYQALGLLRLKDSMSPAELFEQGQDFWHQSREGGDFIKNLEAGRAAAEKLRDEFVRRVAEFPTA